MLTRKVPSLFACLERFERQHVTVILLVTDLHQRHASLVDDLSRGDLVVAGSTAFCQAISG
jgi:hypothetical protein